MELTTENRNTRRKPCPNTALFTANLTQSVYWAGIEPLYLCNDKNSVRTVQRTLSVSLMNNSQLKWFRKVIAVYYENHKKHKAVTHLNVK